MTSNVIVMLCENVFRFASVCILNSKRNANVCSHPVQSHYDEKFIHDKPFNESKGNSGNMFFGHLSFKLYSLVQSLHFSTHASSKQNSQRQNMVNFYSIKHRKFYLRFFCCSVYFKKKGHYVGWRCFLRSSKCYNKHLPIIRIVFL